MKNAVLDHPTVIWCPLSRKPPSISTQTLHCQKLESFLHFCCWQCGSTFIQIFVVSSEKHVVWNAVHNRRWRSSKVVDFGNNRKRACDFVLVIDSNLLCTVSDIRQLAENRQFSLPHSHLIPPLGVNHFKFQDNLIENPTAESSGYLTVKIVWS